MNTRPDESGREVSAEVFRQPLSSECGTHKTVKAILRPQLSCERPENIVRCSFLAPQQLPGDGGEPEVPRHVSSASQDAQAHTGSLPYRGTSLTRISPPPFLDHRRAGSGGEELFRESRAELLRRFRRGNSLKGCQAFHLKAKARIWP